jgi:uncharacterized protein
VEALAHALKARRGGSEPTVSSGRVVVLGEAQWTLTGAGTLVEEVQTALSDVGVSCERIGGGLLIDFGNAVGLFPIPGVGAIEVVSGKWTPHDFDVMLTELGEIASGLPFSAAQGGSLPFERAVVARHAILYHAFAYLRQVTDEGYAIDERLGTLLDLVLTSPHRTFERVRVRVPVDRAARFDASGLTKLASGGLDLVRPAGNGRDAVLTRALRGFLPLEVEESHVSHSVDTAENRFVKAFLELCGDITRGMRQLVAAEKGLTRFAKRLNAECDRIERSFEPAARHPLWREVGAMARLPVESTVLQRRRGYAGLFRHFSRLQLAARVPLDRHMLWDLLEGKDIALLYELWCYFTVVSELTDLLGQPLSADAPHAGPLQVGIRWHYCVEWRTPHQHVRALYNASFSRGKAGYYSYSALLRPDIAIAVTFGVERRLHVLDAKFRLHRLGDLLPAGADDSEDELPDIARAERGNTFVRGDLYKVHAFRDALEGVRSAWILYPGTEFRFFGAGGDLVQDPAALRPAPAGVGGIPLTPGGRDGALRAVLESFLRDRV